MSLEQNIVTAIYGIVPKSKPCTHLPAQGKTESVAVMERMQHEIMTWWAEQVRNTDTTALQEKSLLAVKTFKTIK